MSQYESFSHSVLSGGANYKIIDMIFSLPLVRDSLDAGGWLAGGFPRNALLGSDLTDYFRWEGNGIARPGRPGDVDIFFPTAEIAQQFTNHRYASSKSSIGGFAKESHVWIDGKNLVNMQVIDHPDLCHGSLEKCLESFDFENCRVAITKDHVVAPKGWRALEESKLIRILNNSSPFMGSRVMRYLTQRGMSGLTHDSSEKLVEWLCRAATENFPGYDSRHMNGIKTAVMNMAESGYLRQEDLILFLGKWTKIMSEGKYGKYFTVEVDWAINKIEELSVKDQPTV